MHCSPARRFARPTAGDAVIQRLIHEATRLSFDEGTVEGVLHHALPDGRAVARQPAELRFPAVAPHSVSERTAGQRSAILLRDAGVTWKQTRVPSSCQLPVTTSSSSNRTSTFAKVKRWMLPIPISTNRSPVRDVAVEVPRTIVRKAIILAAGVGDRLQPFTQQFPKCLAPVCDLPILVSTLTHLSDVGVSEVVIVVGHHKEKIYERVGDTFQAVKVTYIESAKYASTNNIYSLWLAREHLVEDVLLLEADVLFERRAPRTNALA